MSKHHIAAALLFLVTVVSYANIFSNQFVFDDHSFIVNNIHIRELSNIPSFFGEPSQQNLYRPLRTVMYTLVYALGGDTLWVYHTHSILLHFLATMLVFGIIWRMSKKYALSLITGLLFAAHPIHTARVTNMTATFDLYGILLLLLGFYLYIVHRESKNHHYYYGSVTSYLLALFASEEAIVLVPLLLLYDWLFQREQWSISNLAKRYTPYVLISAVYIFVRYSVIGQFGRTTTYFADSFLVTQLTTVKVFAHYLGTLLVPLNLSIHKTIDPVQEITLMWIGCLLLLVTLIAIGVWVHRKFPLVSVSIGLFFITLLPFANFFPQVTIMADRYLYVPSIGFCLLVALGILWIAKQTSARSVVAIGLTVFLVAAYAVISLDRNQDYTDSFSLYGTTVDAKGGGGTMAHASLAEHYMKAQDYPRAINHSLLAIQLQPDNFYAYKTLGQIFAELENYPRAIEYYNKSLQIRPDLYQSYNNMGLVYYYMGEMDQAEIYVRKAIELDPTLSKAYSDLGTIYAQQGKFEQARESFEQAIAINPYEPSYYTNYAVLLDFLGEQQQAQEARDKAEQLAQNS